MVKKWNPFTIPYFKSKGIIVHTKKNKEKCKRFFLVLIKRKQRKDYTFSSNPLLANFALAISRPPAVAQYPTKPITNNRGQKAIKKKQKNSINPMIITINFEFRKRRYIFFVTGTN
jgi:hypothetical protein